MKRAIVAAVLVVLAIIFVASVVDWGGQASELRPKPATRKHAPGSTAGGFDHGSDAEPADE